MQDFHIERDNDRDLVFQGELIAAVGNALGPNGNRGRWFVLCLYRTESGALVAERIGRTRYRGETDRHQAVVCRDDDAGTAVEKVIAFFGLGALAKNLYEKANIEVTERVD